MYLVAERNKFEKKEEKEIKQIKKRPIENQENSVGQ
jgi:hypothetical protein